MDSIGEFPHTLETDIQIANVVADRLNKFVDEGILTAQDLQKAEADSFDTFVLRIMHKEYLGKKLEPEDIAKVQGIFRSERIDPLPNQPRPEEIISSARRLLEGMREQSYDFDGLLIHGSSLNKKMILRAGNNRILGSDVDLDILLGNQGVMEYQMATNSTQTNLYGMSSEDIYRESVDAFMHKYVPHPSKKDLPIFRNIETHVSTFMSPDDFDQQLRELAEKVDSVPEMVASFPYWAWKADCVAFVSVDPILEKTTQEKLSKILHSAVVEDKRRKILDGYKMLVTAKALSNL